MSTDTPILTMNGETLPPTLTHERGWDTRDGRRIDRYIGSDGYHYERVIPQGGGFCPEVQGVVPGREPFWRRLDGGREAPMLRSRL